MKEIKEIEK